MIEEKEEFNTNHQFLSKDGNSKEFDEDVNNEYLKIESYSPKT